MARKMDVKERSFAGLKVLASFIVRVVMTEASSSECGLFELNG